MARFGIQAISLNGTQLGGVSGWQFDPGREVDSTGLDGSIYETSHHVTTLKPSAQITTRSLKVLMQTLNGSTDLPLIALDGSNGLRMVAAKAAAAAPGYASGTVHVQRTFLRGVAFLSGVSWSRGGKAEATISALARGNGDGTTASVTETLITNPAIPAADFGFTLTALTINGVSIPTVDSISLTISPNFEHEYLTGLPEPTDITGAGVRKEMAITLSAEIGDCDIGAGTGATSLVFTRYAIGGGLTTDTVTFTLNGPWSSEDGVGGASNAPATRRLTVRSRWNGTTKPLTWATA